MIQCFALMQSHFEGVDFTALAAGFPADVPDEELDRNEGEVQAHAEEFAAKIDDLVLQR